MTVRHTAFRVIALAALSVTAVLLTDDAQRVPSFCPFESGCAVVTTSPIGKPLGIPLSGIGLTAFLLFFGATFLTGEMIERMLDRFAIAAAFIGMLLVAYQYWMLQSSCRYCLLADAAGILLAAVALAFPAEENEERQEGIGARWGWGSLALVAVVLPPAWAMVSPGPTVPREVQEAWVEGQVNIVEITDFDCPFCRRTHQLIEELRRDYPGRIHLVRVVPPVAGQEATRIAAKAYGCAVRQGRGDAMANLLFQSGEFTESRMRQLAAESRLDLDRFEKDFHDPAMDRELMATRKWVAEQGLPGLPQVWVQEILLWGEPSPEVLRSAAARVGLR